jgi:hypothetical protein
MTEQIAEIAAKLNCYDCERLTGWQGVRGAAYNVVSEYLCGMGLLNRDWSLAPLGQQVAAYLEEQSDGQYYRIRHP